MKSLITLFLALLLTHTSIALGKSNNVLENSKRFLIKDTHLIKDQDAARSAVMDFLSDDRQMKEYFVANVIRLTRSTHDVGKSLKRGDVVWVVDVANTASSNLWITPEGTYWVKAVDGEVFETVPIKHERKYGLKEKDEESKP